MTLLACSSPIFAWEICFRMGILFWISAWTLIDSAVISTLKNVKENLSSNSNVSTSVHAAVILNSHSTMTDSKQRW